MAMKFNPSQKDLVKKWAEFSGDFNPIHFDLDAAARTGLPALVTHGMLLLLPIKQDLSIELTAVRHASIRQFQFKSYFRAPVAQDSAVELKRTLGAARTNFSLLSNGLLCFRGSMAPAETAGGGLINTGQKKGTAVSITASEVERQRKKFRSSFPFIVEDWIFLDALVFSSFLSAQFKRFGLPGADALAVQTHHHVAFDLPAIDRYFSHPDGWTGAVLEYTCAETTVDSADGNQLGCANIDIMAAGQWLMHMEIGLSLRQHR
jgi:MaoC like domain